MNTLFSADATQFTNGMFNVLLLSYTSVLSLIRLVYHYSATGAYSYCVWAERGVNPFHQKNSLDLKKHPPRLCVLFSAKFN